MANKQSFTPEEWTKVLESTMLAGMAVSAAEPSGLWGLVKEGFASSSALAAAKSDAGLSELIKAVVAEYETSEGRSSVQDANAQTVWGPSRVTPFNAHLTVYARSQQSSMPKHRTTRQLLKRGYAA